MATQANQQAANSGPNYTVPFIIVAALFGIFGFLTSLNNQLVDKLKQTFDLGYGQAALATAAWFLAYLVFSVPSAKLIEWVGYKKTMVISLFVMVLGALAFIPAASAISFPMTLGAIFLLATGVCALQTSANPYAAILGPESSAALRVNLAQAFNSAASAVAPIVATTFILSSANSASSPAEQAHMLIGPYVAIAVSLLVLGFIVMGLHLPAVNMTRDFRPSDSEALTRSIWSYKHVVLGMVSIFFYVGVEQALAAYGVRFALQQGITGTTAFGKVLTAEQVAGYLISAYWLLAMLGRFAGSALMTRIKPYKMLFTLGIVAVLLMVAGMVTSGTVAVACLILCGAANSIMYPTIFALGIAELGPLTSKGSGVITIGNVGGAVIPVLFGVVIDHMGGVEHGGIQHAFVLAIVCYLFITYYGIAGYKPSRAK